MDGTGELVPAFLKLAGRKVVIVGGGAVASTKLLPLVRAGARVTVVAPEVAPALRADGVRIVLRRFRASDLDGAWFVVAAAPPAVNRAAARAAGRRRIFINAADDPANASVYFGGVLRRAGVTIAISTDGEAPALAGLLREGLDALLPDDLDRWMSTARALRQQQRSACVPMAARRPQLVTALSRLYPREFRAGRDGKGTIQ